MMEILDNALERIQALATELSKKITSRKIKKKNNKIESYPLFSVKMMERLITMRCTKAFSFCLARSFREVDQIHSCLTQTKRGNDRSTESRKGKIL